MDWKNRWGQAPDLWMKFFGILLTSLLLSLGAPFWYNALKNLIRLRSLIAQKDDDQRDTRQSQQDKSTTSATATPLVIAGERGDLTNMG